MRPADTIPVLVVDDESGMRQLVTRYLEGQQLTVVAADGGDQALAAAAAMERLQLLITDEMMPNMEGHELARRLRAANPDLKVLYLTANPDHLFDEKQQLWDQEAYLGKPFTRDGLHEAVAHLLFGRMTL